MSLFCYFLRRFSVIHPSLNWYPIHWTGCARHFCFDCQSADFHNWSSDFESRWNSMVSIERVGKVVPTLDLPVDLPQFWHRGSWWLLRYTKSTKNPIPEQNENITRLNVALSLGREYLKPASRLSVPLLVLTSQMLVHTVRFWYADQSTGIKFSPNQLFRVP